MLCLMTLLAEQDQITMLYTIFINICSIVCKFWMLPNPIDMMYNRCCTMLSHCFAVLTFIILFTPNRSSQPFPCTIIVKFV
ncbi:MAG: hypothetical protein ACI4TG_01670 [Ruminococcus sp.]